MKTIINTVFFLLLANFYSTLYSQTYECDDLFPFPSDCERFSYPFPISMPQCNTKNYRLVFEDNFNGSTLDLNKWELQAWGQGSLNGGNSDQVYTLEPDNIEVSNGTLKIIAVNQPKTRRAINYLPDNQILSDGLPNLRTYQYSSSNIWTIWPYDSFHYGKYEIRCRISKGKGLWPAFWTYSGDADPGGPIWSELDVFEIYYDKEYSNNFSYTNNIHFDLNNDGKTCLEQCSYRMIGSDYENWHTYTCYFDNDKIDFYIDGVFINRKTRYLTTSNQPIYCGDGEIGGGSAWDLNGWVRQPGRMILNMAIETGNAPNSQTFPGVFEVDYVRFWKKDAIPCNNGILKMYPFSGTYVGDNGLLLFAASVESGNYADITVQNELHILPNFKAKNGSYFHAKADPVACGISARVTNEEEDSTLNYEKYPNLENEDETIASRNQNSELLIFPNPTNGLINIELNSNKSYFEIEVFSLLGELVYVNKVNSPKLTFDLSQYPKGMYLVKIKQDNRYYHEKISYY